MKISVTNNYKNRNSPCITPRQLKCPRCGFRAGRDIIAVLNLEKKYSTSKGPVPLAPMPSEPAPEVAVLPMKEWARRKSLDAINKHELIRISI